MSLQYQHPYLSFMALDPSIKKKMPLTQIVAIHDDLISRSTIRGTLLLRNVNICECSIHVRESKMPGFCFKIEALKKTLCYKHGLNGETLSKHNDLFLVFRNENVIKGKEWFTQIENAISLAITKYKTQPTSTVREQFDSSSKIKPSLPPKTFEMIKSTPYINVHSYNEEDIKKVKPLSPSSSLSQINALKTKQIEQIQPVPEIKDTKKQKKEETLKEEKGVINNSLQQSLSHYVLAQNDLKEFFDATEEGKSIIWELLKQVRPGMDLSRITFPSHILEPRSFLVKTTDYFAHIQYFKPISEEPDPGLRMLGLVKWLLSGFYLMPTGIKKPYNPILGETFRTMWKHEDGSRSYLLGEQVSHHPPVSAFYATNRQQGWMGNGYIDFTTKFNGLSASIILGGKIDIYLLNFNEHYTMTFPEALASGFFVGPMLMEIAGKSVFECKETGYKAEVIFNLRGTFSSDKYQTVDAKITKNGEEVYKIWGNYYKELFYCGKDKVKKSLLKIDDIRGKSVPRYTIDMNQQGKMESDKLWIKVTNAIYKGDQITATEEKCILEEAQREEVRKHESEGTVHIPKYFVKDSFLGWKYVDFNNSKFNPDKELGDYEDEYHIKPLLKEQNDCIGDGKQVKEELLTSSNETNNSETLKTDHQSSMNTQNSGDEKCKKVDELKEELNQVEARIKNITFTQNQKTIDIIKQLKKFIVILLSINIVLIALVLKLLLK
ncbi:oxysterol binding protein, putative [Entamoeba histolytica HM-1:IMSS]|uniref:Oxysterol binding protein, putative n=1 Tax=Entamoeba histolytica (strain ATCC 30459 / HM-1:IMSS / ABRM) TaxID=294381 RepID=C4LTR1_ENTH1|nr:oxysterol binding protein, putative [Entamoeba histolytica HM-1:IMSS]EAL51182.1 oxysterol binding protein, putative [Entamoeba histolytica HM-1:IMSS]|eukprot:XP_656568.1 oxysterol binding protein, putative [Entamoeba histolytica HM-1:IMSS]